MIMVWEVCSADCKESITHSRFLPKVGGILCTIVLVITADWKAGCDRLWSHGEQRMVGYGLKGGCSVKNKTERKRSWSKVLTCHDKEWGLVLEEEVYLYFIRRVTAEQMLCLFYVAGRNWLKPVSPAVKEFTRAYQDCKLGLLNTL